MKNMITDIHQMHQKYGVHEWMEKQADKGDWSLLHKYLQFRLEFISEELLETVNAKIADDKPEIVDGLIDIIVVALGTLDAFDVDIQKAWDQVHEANMSKTVGVKPTRPNPLGLPDLIKPKGWVAPNHDDNTGIL
jgi:hypothetical protein